MTGLRDPALEAVRHDGDGCMGLRPLGNGTMVLDVNTDDALDIDEEGCFLFLDFEFERAMAEHDEGVFNPTAAYHHYVGLGMLSLSPGGVSTIDYMLRRSAFKTRHRLAGQVDHMALLARSVTAQEAGISESAHRTHPLAGRSGASAQAAKQPVRKHPAPPASEAANQPASEAA
jgi:hypothetical protein